MGHADAQQLIERYLEYVRVEKRLAQRTVELYALDLSKLTTFAAQVPVALTSAAYRTVLVAVPVVVQIQMELEVVQPKHLNQVGLPMEILVVTPLVAVAVQEP